MNTKIRSYKKLIVVIISLTVLLSLPFIIASIHSNTMPQPSTFWELQAIDTMKYSRDGVNNQDIINKIPAIMDKIAQAHATYVSIDTPYNEEFYPILKLWVIEARKHQLHVWFRGNFAQWEGWFNYPKIINISDHHTMTRNFIMNHQELFQDGDIFTPAPEPENGGIGDPRGSDEKIKVFNQFLIDSYTNCQSSFEKIQKNVFCGYFSMNGDIAKTVLTKETVKKIGNVVVIDHYVKSPDIMSADIDYLHNLYGAKIVIGEFGAPIPDINGDMDEKRQSEFVESLLNILSQKNDIVQGINYWVIGGGSTALLNDDGSEREVYNTVTNYYNPYVLNIKVFNTAGETVNNPQISFSGSAKPSAVQKENYTYVTTSKFLGVHVTADGYVVQSQSELFNQQTKDLEFTLEPVNPSIWYRLKVFFMNLFDGGHFNVKFNV